MSKPPVRVAVTGGAGQIGYALLFRIASGQMLGPDQPVILQLLEITPAMKALEGVVMELNDAAFPLVHGIEMSDDANVAFDGASVAYKRVLWAVIAMNATMFAVESGAGFLAGSWRRADHFNRHAHS